MIRPAGSQASAASIQPRVRRRRWHLLYTWQTCRGCGHSPLTHARMGPHLHAARQPMRPPSPPSAPCKACWHAWLVRVGPYEATLYECRGRLAVGLCWTRALCGGKAAAAAVSQSPAEYPDHRRVHKGSHLLPPVRRSRRRRQQPGMHRPLPGLQKHMRRLAAEGRPRQRMG